MKNAMLDAINGAHIANKIRMERSQHAGSFLVVEGVSDKRFFDWLIDKNKCKIVVAYGRDKALDAFHRLQVPSFDGVLFVIDADFDAIEGRKPPSISVIFTDTHDLETMLLASPAFEKVLLQVGSEEKVDKFRGQYGDLRACLLRCAKHLGYMLWLSRKDRLNLKFEELKFGKFVDEKTLLLDPAEMVKVVANHSQRPDLKNDVLLTRLAALYDDGHDPLHVCCGHHLTEILAFALRKAWGTNDAGAFDGPMVERMLVLAYDEGLFVTTQLYASIRAWESQHPPFIVLRALGTPA
ncbi:DUF4435 domain-containing protein [Polyangium jinanense]|uniref:DUF4435 domain-containing protein n=1 Tax=Polyangium jinanense TaxID=2829994 RepID=A0A9X3X9V8_9BACT|nr:DUF4435 domain-containing protein [Polyangium jinanense]MDC3956012.1 DUF4435 domain-containing protein [Polyangium jinanense]MDC3961481.1 DUF4435 domain-containing protein [Polyangium jinanense]MDC3986372.1 DUF4435 domain-containing protein [Polyangium jinanense]